MSIVAPMRSSYEPTRRVSQRRAPAAAPPARPALRLTRRGRLVLGCLAGLLAALSALLVRPSEATDRAGDPHYSWVTVGSGETLWELATTAVPGVDPRTTVERIIELNGLSSGAVHAGQRIAVPWGGEVS